MQEKLTKKEIEILVDRTPFVKYVSDHSTSSHEYLFSLHALSIFLDEVQEYLNKKKAE